MSKKKPVAKIVVTSKPKLTLTKVEMDILLDAASRMQADDVWDEYRQSQADALESARGKLQDALEACNPPI